MNSWTKILAALASLWGHVLLALQESRRRLLKARRAMKDKEINALVKPTDDNSTPAA